MIDRRRLLLGGSVVAVIGAAALGGPALLRRVDAFGIRSVEVSGVRLLTPGEVLAASGVRHGQNLFEEKEQWISALRAHDGIEGVEIRRRLPGTLRIRVIEKEPVALVEDGVLRLATESGELLPMEPVGADLDLPIVRATASDTAGLSPDRRRLLAEVGRLAEIDPVLFAEISEVRPADGDAIALAHRHADILLPAGVTPLRIAELRAVLANLVERAGVETLERVTRVTVDLRFADQIVVRFPSSV